MEFETVSPVANQAAASYVQQRQGVKGRQMAALGIKMESLKARLKANGTAQPATILNFNPVPLRLEGGLPYKVPSVIDPAVAEDRKLQFTYRGRPYRCSLLTIETPFLYTIPVDVFRKTGSEMADGVGVYDILACLQVESAHNFYAAYNGMTQEAANMGGVVIFEGTRNVLKEALKGNDVILKVPTFIKLPNNQREYFCEPKSFKEVLAPQLDKQRGYYETEMQTASMYNNDNEGRKNITQIHRVWHQFGLDMGFTQKVEPWLTSQSEPDETCGGCGAGKKRGTAYFCHACARPYSPLEAYLAGELSIDSVHMNRIQDADWAIVRKEEARRKALRKSLLDEPEKPKA